MFHIFSFRVVILNHLNSKASLQDFFQKLSLSYSHPRFKISAEAETDTYWEFLIGFWPSLSETHKKYRCRPDMSIIASRVIASVIIWCVSAYTSRNTSQQTETYVSIDLGILVLKPKGKEEEEVVALFLCGPCCSTSSGPWWRGICYQAQAAASVNPNMLFCLFFGKHFWP